jgi:hypothetical protein
MWTPHSRPAYSGKRQYKRLLTLSDIDEKRVTMGATLDLCALFNPCILKIEQMKSLVIMIIGLFSVAIYGQEIKPEFNGQNWEAPYTLPIPKGWTIERFLIPISFAPQIPYKGVEDIRFTPGWGKVLSEEYWSYAFLWYLEGDVNIDCQILDSNLKAYYTGLIASNGSNIPGEKIIPVMTSFKEVQNDTGDFKTYTGTIKMVDYMEQKPIILNCKAHLKSCPGENKTFIFYELSPKPLSHYIWLSLDKLWLDFKCK